MIWDDLYAHLVCSLGWDFDKVREDLDIPRIMALNRYWEHSPPVHITVARYVGIKAPEMPKPIEAGAAELMGLIDQGAF